MASPSTHKERGLPTIGKGISRSVEVTLANAVPFPQSVPVPITGNQATGVWWEIWCLQSTYQKAFAEEKRASRGNKANIMLAAAVLRKKYTLRGRETEHREIRGGIIGWKVHSVQLVGRILLTGRKLR